MRCTILAAAAAAALFSLPAPVSGQADSIFYVHRSSMPLLRLNVDGGFAVMGTTEGTMPVLGAGRRMMWIPSRAAFRAGEVGGANGESWDTGIGLHSAAFGYNTQAAGQYSFATGYGSSAADRSAVAMGENAVASSAYSFAAASGRATGLRSVAIGTGAQTHADDAVALGRNADVRAQASIAIGNSSVYGGSSVAIGTNNTIWNSTSFAIGADNSNNASNSIAIGFQNSASGRYSVAIGKNARTANRGGSIVISDASAGFSSDSVYPTANNQIVMRGAGGIKMFTNQQLTAGVELAAGGASWSSVSDRNRKENFLDLDGEEVLTRLREVPVSTWNYLTQEEEIRHVGPMAQDFYRAFGLGESDLLINTIDIDGINMAGVKALDARTQAQALRIEALEAEVTDLRARLERLEKLIGDDAR